MFEGQIEKTNASKSAESESKVELQQRYINDGIVEEVQESTYSKIDNLLENEKKKNKNEVWNKLDKTVKIQKLHIFAEKYGKDNNLPIKEVKNLKQYFNDSLNKNKIQKTKDVVYDREKGIVNAVHGLMFNSHTHNFTIRNMDSKHVSTVKLTSKRLEEMKEKK